jgi:ubiquinone/menaquinone biosynthesis C-methylase UbiE
MQSIQQRSVLDTNRLLERLGIEEGMRVADLGSGGHDYYVKHVARKIGNTGKMYIIDVRSGPLSALHSSCKSHGFKHVEPIRADIEIHQGINLPDDHCDRVMIINTLHQISEPVSALREASRILKPNGVLLVIDWFSNEGLLGPTANQFAMSDKVVEQAEKAGLAFSHHFDASPHHYGLLFVRS